MRNRRFSRAFALLLAAGCADTTFDLLPPPVETPDAGDGGEGATGEPGTGGLAGSAAGKSGVGGYAGKPVCPPEGCFPGCYPEDGCEPCAEDKHCGGPDKGVCVDFKCARCRTNLDCAKGERCDPWTHECAPDCEHERCSAEKLSVCSGQREVCTECDPNPQSPFNYCPNGLKCSYLGACEKCLFSFYDCPELDQPICSPATWECRKCLNSAECNPGGYPPPSAQKTCEDGRCVLLL